MLVHWYKSTTKGVSDILCENAQGCQLCSSIFTIKCSTFGIFCLLTGILVSGGVDNEDNLLDSVEFYNLATQAWEEISALKNARTEHGRRFKISFYVGNIL